MTQRLPIPGGDDGTWGNILNGFLEVSLNSDGTIAKTAITQAGGEVTSNKGIASGYAGLNSSGLVPTTQLATGSASSSNYLRGDGTWVTPNSGSSALAADSDVAIVSPANNQVLTYVSGSGKWENVAPAVPSIFGRTGAITATTGDYTASQVTGALVNTNNLSDVSDAGSSRANIHVPVLTPAAAVATSNVSLTAPGASCDGYSFSSGDLFLLTAQSTPSQNGLYTWTGASSTLTRPTEFATGATIKGRTIEIQNGTVYGGTTWVLTTATAGIVIDSASQSWNIVQQTYTDERYNNGATINVKDLRFGATGNTLISLTGGMTSSSAVLTDSSGVFLSTDAGKTITVQGAGSAGAVLVTTISAYSSGTSVTLAATASTTVSNTEYGYGTDDTAAVNAAIAALPAGGGEVHLPVGIYTISSPVTVSGGVKLTGVGFDYASPGNATVVPQKATVIRAGSSSAVVNFGSSSDKGTSSLTGYVSTSGENMAFDGANIAPTIVNFYNRRSTYINCIFTRGTTYVAELQCQNNFFIRCVFGGGGSLNSAIACYLNNTSPADCWDNKFLFCEFRFSGGPALESNGSQDLLCLGCHFYASTGANNVKLISGGTNVTFTGCIFDNCTGDIILIQPSSSGVIQAVSVSGCTFFNNAGTTNNTYSWVKIDTTTNSGTKVEGVSITGNTGAGDGYSSQWLAMLNLYGTSYSGIHVVGNSARGGCEYVYTGSRPDGEMLSNSVYNGSNVATFSSNTGQYTGNGGATTITFSHGLAGTPYYVEITPQNAATAAGGTLYWTATSTQVTLTFTNSLASGTNNIAFSWRAQQ